MFYILSHLFPDVFPDDTGAFVRLLILVLEVTVFWLVERNRGLKQSLKWCKQDKDIWKERSLTIIERMPK